MNEHQEHLFGKNVRQALNRGLQGVDAAAQRRLQAARELALGRQKREPQGALAWVGNAGGRLGGWTGFAVYSVVSLALLAGASLGIYNWQLSQRIAELEEIDSQLLTDDLPIDAYLDRGFQNWLKKRGSE